MPVGAFRIFEGLTNGFFELSMPIRVTESNPMVVERRSGKVSDLQQEGQRVVRLEVVDGSNFRPSFLRPQGPQFSQIRDLSAKPFVLHAQCLELALRQRNPRDRLEAYRASSGATRLLRRGGR